MHSMTQQQVRMAKATAGELDDVLRVLQAGVEQARNPPTSVVAGTYMRFSTTNYLPNFDMPVPQTTDKLVRYTDAFGISTLMKAPQQEKRAVSITVEHLSGWNGGKMTWLFRLWPIDVHLNWWAATSTPFCPGAALWHLYDNDGANYTSRPDLDLPMLRRKLPRVGNSLPIPPVFAVFCGNQSDSDLNNMDELYKLFPASDKTSSQGLLDVLSRTGCLVESVPGSPAIEMKRQNLSFSDASMKRLATTQSEEPGSYHTQHRECLSRMHLKEWLTSVLHDIALYTA